MALERERMHIINYAPPDYGWGWARVEIKIANSPNVKWFGAPFRWLRGLGRDYLEYHDSRIVGRRPIGNWLEDQDKFDTCLRLVPFDKYIALVNVDTGQIIGDRIDCYQYAGQGQLASRRVWVVEKGPDRDCKSIKVCYTWTINHEVMQDSSKCPQVSKAHGDDIVELVKFVDHRHRFCVAPVFDEGLVQFAPFDPDTGDRLSTNVYATPFKCYLAKEEILGWTTD